MSRAHSFGTTFGAFTEVGSSHFTLLDSLL
jgi:hypothetical protein